MRTDSQTAPVTRAPAAREQQDQEHQALEKEIKIGKIIFYSTVALSIWFFYWFAGINCPC